MNYEGPIRIVLATVNAGLRCPVRQGTSISLPAPANVDTRRDIREP
jgi:hypothetical protein